MKILKQSARRLMLQLEPTHMDTVEARALIRSTLSLRVIDDNTVDMLSIAIDELIRNAIEHTETTESVFVTLKHTHRTIEAIVKNGKVTRKGWNLPHRQATYVTIDHDTKTPIVKGNGLSICRSFSDQLFVEESPSTTSVHLIKKIG